MLKKLFKDIVEQPYRYLTTTGNVHDRPFARRFYHRAEFKTMAAVTLGAVFLRAALNDTSGITDNVFLVSGAVSGYALARKLGGRQDKMSLSSYYKGKKIIDTKPEEKQATSAEDMAGAISHRSWIKSRANFTLQGVFLGLVAASALAVIRRDISSFDGANDLFGSAAWLGLFGERVANNISDMVRCNRILSGEYVILSSPPEKQEQRQYDTISFGAPEAQPQSAFSPATP